MMIKCKNCNKSVNKKPADVKRNKNNFCSSDCLKSFRKANKNTVKLNCKNCDILFEKRLSQLGSNNFCSRSCSVTYSNLHSNGKRRFGPKKSASRYCRKCNVEISRGRIYCEQHSPKQNVNTKKTLAELKTTKGYKSNHFSMVREHARKVARNAGIVSVCFICGYDKFVQACHIKQISDFNDHSSIEDINAVSNLIGLCPNHHYELDKGKMSEEDRKRIFDKVNGGPRET